jgi:hypothetical protein
MILYVLAPGIAALTSICVSANLSLLDQAVTEDAEGYHVLIPADVPHQETNSVAKMLIRLHEAHVLAATVARRTY